MLIFIENGIRDRDIFAGIYGPSVLVCLLAAVLLLCLKLHKTLVYRLILYQVLSALGFLLVDLLQIAFINYQDSSKNILCTAVWLLLGYTVWVNLLLTGWVTFHLFCLAVLQKDVKKLEVLYVVTSLLVPAVIAIIPLATHSYWLRSDGAEDAYMQACYIYANTSAAFIENLALYDGPAMLMLIATLTAMAVIVIKLASQVCKRSKYKPISGGDQFTKALKQLLPLAVFPVLFIVFEIPVFTYHVFSFQNPTLNEGLMLSAILCYLLRNAFLGVTVIIHISVAQTCGRKHKPIRAINASTSHTHHVATVSSRSNNATRFSLPPASI